ncbi:dimethylamine monooxygenase subunit DmmA family protein [Gordonia soli]|uniref:Dimethylamine monooxygenase subunit DmmA-like C-terminal domain-containing protein n=1 Tax=Gordonia soli NBRC 108243 TaxID=1223545 RepID=M0QFK1_9ACTN|nr:dimethylamine monooxygenase subunit DmmA family protein [Gordonia soli]GAC67343.1 hypothetical protein GS4_07_00920 [Gordonia soli NBRC 108243]
MATTSVPRWSARALDEADIDPLAANVLVVTTGPTAAAHVENRRDAMAAAHTVIDVAELGDALSESRTGWRFVLVGDGAAVARARTEVLGAGAIDDEIVTVALDEMSGFGDGARDVFCAHCHATTATDAGIDESMVCDGCDVTLVVYHHFSRRRHAYLGYRPDAEELS